MTERLTISISGVVGSGKSTTAQAIVDLLRSQGREAEHVRFRELVSVAGQRTRPGTSQNGGEPGPTAEPARRGVGYRQKRLTIRTAAGYIARSMLFRARVRRWPVQTVLIFDRYFYDSLAHYEIGRTGWLMKAVEGTVPTPTVGVLLLHEPHMIGERRPLYSSEYITLASLGYEQLARRFNQLIVFRGFEADSAESRARRVVGELVSRQRQTIASAT
jgi:thymidylate kinase